MCRTYMSLLNHKGAALKAQDGVLDTSPRSVSQRSATNLCRVQHVLNCILFLFSRMWRQHMFLAFTDAAQGTRLFQLSLLHICCSFDQRPGISLSPLTVVNAVNHGFKVRPMNNIIKPYFLFYSHFFFSLEVMRFDVL